MSILSKISKGRIAEPQKIVIYGPQKIGKTTLASLFPGALFLDTEEGTGRMSVARIRTATLTDFDEAVAELRKNGLQLGYHTIVVDTIDWLETRMKEHVVKTVSLKERSYGREESFVADELSRRLSALTGLISAGLNVVLLAHSTVVKVDLPDQPAPFDRYELDMGKKYCAPMVKHWADHLLFCKWKMSVREPDEGRNKAIGKDDRLLCFTQSAAYDAGSRSSITGEHRMEFPPTDTLLRRIFEDVGAPWGAEAGKPVAATATPKAQNPVSTASTPGTTANAQTSTETAGNGQPLAADGAAKTPPVATGTAGETPTTSPHTYAGTANTEAPSDLPRSADPIPGIEQAEDEDPELANIIGGHEAEVNAYLIAQRKIKVDQSYRSMPREMRARVLKNPAGFLKVATAAKEGRAA